MESDVVPRDQAPEYEQPPADDMHEAEQRQQAQQMEAAEEAQLVPDPPQAQPLEADPPAPAE
jgi:hypothetical protein